ncbi:hypothetical protein EXIGLDRAFT_735184 [Exidia glandulosa HHB12029]|uniref:DUF6534 domain-containing protein n=1 Tax=Exidia glandulosa HHB12029 TaxID=1314781 RepID=A0A165JWZ6_EXIGL|nr:hypothetical protein EXIGLDRAFT_735184 [Exidia glandulosa HHB12029]
METAGFPAPSMPLGIDLSSTFGVIEIAILLVMFLTGIATLQTWNYFRDYPQDKAYIKLAVGVVYIMDLLHTSFLAQGLHHYTIRNFGNFLELDNVIGTLIGTALLGGIIAFAVRTYFCLRIKVITYTPIYALFCWILSIALLVLDILVAVNVAKSGSLSKIHTPGSLTQKLGLASLLIGAADDLLIAGFLCMGLLKARKSSGFEGTHRMLDKLIAYTISSGVLTSVMAVVEAIVFNLSGNSNYAFFAFYFIIPKLFGNSFLASLNERSYLRRDGAPSRTTSTHTGSNSYSGSRTPPSRVTFERSTIVTGRSEVHFELGTVNTSETRLETGLDDKERGLIRE